MSGNIEDRIISFIMLGAVSVAAFIGYKYLKAEENPIDIPGTSWLCSLLGGTWNSETGICSQNQTTPPDVVYPPLPVGNCPVNYEWDPFRQVCLWAGGDEYLEPIPCLKTKPCDDGSYVCSTEVCPPYEPPVQTTISCTCNGQIMTFPMDGRSCGEHCDDVLELVETEPCFGGNIAVSCLPGWTDNGPVEGLPGYRCCTP